MNRRFFAILGALVALSGCAGAPVNKYTEADLPQPSPSVITRVGNTLEMNVTVPSCGDECVVTGEWQASGEVSRQLLTEKVGGATSRQISVTNVPARTKGIVKINVKNYAGVVRLENAVEVSLPQVEARTQAELFRGFIPSRGASTVFRSAEQCRQAAFAGAFEYYVPTRSARHPVAKADGETRTLAKLEGFYCLEMDTTMGKLWVVAEKGKDEYIWQDNRIDGNAKCLNRVYNSFPLIPPDSPVASLLTQGNWTRQNFVSQEKVSSIDWGKTAGLAVGVAAVACIIWCGHGGGGNSAATSVPPTVTTLPVGPGVTTLPAGFGAGPGVTTLFR